MLRAKSGYRLYLRLRRVSTRLDSFWPRPERRRGNISQCLLLLLVLPTLAVAQAQCTLYQAQKDVQYQVGPGPLEPSLAAAVADAGAILAQIPPLQAPGFTIYGYVFDGCTGDGIHSLINCHASWGGYGGFNGIPQGATPPHW